MAERYAQIAAVILIFKKDGKILLEQRSASSHWCPGHYAIPGGCVDAGETIFAAAVREAREELGVEIDPKDLRVAHLLHRGTALGVQAIILFLEAVAWRGEPHVAEVGMAQQICWCDPGQIPQPMVPYIPQALACINNGIMYSEWGWAPSLR